MEKKPKYQFRRAPYMGFVADNNQCDWHYHRHAEISYILEGTQRFIIGNQTYLLSPGDLLIVFPNQVHDVKTPVYCRAITSLFDAYLTTDFTKQLSGYKLKNPVLKKEELLPETLDAISELGNTGISKSYKQHLIPYLEKGYLNVVLFNVFLKRSLIPHDYTDETFLITRFLNYIENNLSCQLTSDSVAHALNTDKYLLSRAVSYHLGNSPHVLINSRRMDLARYLLRNTDIPAEHIAFEAGFSSKRSFFRNFKETFQKTPIEYRQRKSQEELEKRKFR